MHVQLDYKFNESRAETVVGLSPTGNTFIRKCIIEEKTARCKGSYYWSSWAKLMSIGKWFVQDSTLGTVFIFLNFYECLLRGTR